MTAVDLVAATRRGDADAFGELVDRFQGMASGYAGSLLGDPGLAEDACQEAFIDAFTHLHQLRDDAAFPGWFRRIVLKHADRQRRGRLLYHELADLPGAVDPLAAVIEAEQPRELQARVAELPDRLREAVLAFYGAGHPVAAIAEFLEVPEGTVKKRLFDARARLREDLPAPRPAPAGGPRDAVELLLASRVGDARRAAAVLARRPDLANLAEQWTDPDAMLAFGTIGKGLTALQRAVFMGHVEVARVLLDAGASQSAGTGLRPLDLAVLQDDHAMAKLLLERGAPVSGFPDGVLTPLHRAAMRGLEDMARLLLEAGAAPGARGPAGRTPPDWARLKECHGLATLIEEYE